MKVEEIIRNKLTESLEPVLLEIIDESAQHAGHAGAREGGESHFAVLVVSDKFIGKNRVARQREVFSVLKQELEEKVHALRFIGLYSDEEYKQEAI